MKKNPRHKELKPENYYCAHCLLLFEEYVEATHMVWIEEEEKALPLCAHHFKQLDEAENEPLYKFSKN
jgi:hypothetical protein